MDFQSKIDISDEQKVNIILKLLESSRSQIMTWHNQAYIAATASLGLILIVTNLWLHSLNKTLIGLFVYEISIILFSALTFIYLKATHDNYENNEKHKLKCEYALRLKDENAYFDGARFYWAESGEMERGMPARDLTVLRWSHAVASFLLATICVIGFLGFNV